MHIDKLDDVVNEDNNTYILIIHILNILKKLMIKILNLKLVIMLQHQNTKKFLLKDILQIGLKKFLWLKKLKILLHEHMLLMISMMKILLERFMKKKYKEKTNKDLGWKKSLKGKKINHMSNGKDMIIH